MNLYSSENHSAKEFTEVKSYLETVFPSVKISVRPTVFRNVPKREVDGFAEALASARMKDPLSAQQMSEPMFGEIDYERRAILGRSKVGGVVYDGGDSKKNSSDSWGEEHRFRLLPLCSQTDWFRPTRGTTCAIT